MPKHVKFFGKTTIAAFVITKVTLMYITIHMPNHLCALGKTTVAAFVLTNVRPNICVNLHVQFQT